MGQMKIKKHDIMKSGNTGTTSSTVTAAASVDESKKNNTSGKTAGKNSPIATWRPRGQSSESNVVVSQAGAANKTSSTSACFLLTTKEDAGKMLNYQVTSPKNPRLAGVH